MLNLVQTPSRDPHARFSFTSVESAQDQLRRPSSFGVPLRHGRHHPNMAMMACDDRRDPPLCASAVAPTELQPSPSPAFTPRVSRVATIAVVAVVLCVCGVVFGGRVASSIRDVPGLAAAAAPGSLAASDDGVAAPVPLGVTTADADRGSSSGSARGDEGGGAVGVPPPLGGHDANGQAGHVRRPPPLRHVYRLPLDAAPPPTSRLMCPAPSPSPPCR